MSVAGAVVPVGIWHPSGFGILGSCPNHHSHHNHHAGGRWGAKGNAGGVRDVGAAKAVKIR